jgi:hypothetical protein
MNRRVEPELLDTLPPEDPRASRSRADLRRINAWMGNASHMARALLAAFPDKRPKHLVELGAGDGHFMLRLAQLLAPKWPGVSVTLLDRQEPVSGQAQQSLEALGWHVTSLTTDVFDWFRRPDLPQSDAIIANLFLHHFSETLLAELLAQASQRTQVFIALEPRRSSFSLTGSRLVGLIGCNEVTRHDAVVSVRAGFTGGELTQLWPEASTWNLAEHPAGPFGHLLRAKRSSCPERS